MKVRDQTCINVCEFKKKLSMYETKKHDINDYVGLSILSIIYVIL